MNTKKRLNCYVFGNLIVSFLTLDLLVNPTSTVLVAKKSDATLNKIYEKEVAVSSIPDTIISSEENVIVTQISNPVNNETKTFNYVKPSYNSVTGINLVNYAKNFLGLRYVSAGNSLTTGTDCSGFTRLIYGEFGISLGRTVSSQLYSGTFVSREDLQPGDLVFYSYGSVASHVAIYMGDGLIIHESNPRDGVKIGSVNIMNYITARRLITVNVVSSPTIEENVAVPVVEENKEVPETIKEEPVVKNNDEEVLEPTEVIEETNEQPEETPVEVVESTEKIVEEDSIIEEK